MSGVSKILGKPKDIREFSPDYRLVLPTTRIGLEFEYEGCHNITLPANVPEAILWQWHKEQSLKDKGAEYVFAAPMFGKDATRAIEWLMGYAKQHEWKCTLRTGIHVHMDVRDLEVDQLVGFQLLYAIVEPLLFRWIGDERDESNFCIPWYKAEESLLQAAAVIRRMTQDNELGTHAAVGAAKNYDRYAALNLKALEQHGSLEFRHMRTTHDVERVFDWINLILALKAAVLRLPQSDGAIIQLAESMHTNDFVQYIFGTALANKLLATTNPYSSLDEDLYLGTCIAKDLALQGFPIKKWTRSKYPSGDHPGTVRKRMKRLRPTSGEPAPERRPLDQTLLALLKRPRRRLTISSAQGTDPTEAENQPDEPVALPGAWDGGVAPLQPPIDDDLETF